MKRININISKDTPEEILTELYAALKTGKGKTSLKVSELYLSNEDIEKLNDRYEQLFKKVKDSLNLSETQIAQECEILSLKYLFEIQLFSESRKVDYEIKLAEIKARRRELKPWRRCWLWRLLFQPLTNRAQDIIEKRAEVDADIIHTALEKETDKEREKLPADENDTKLSKRKLKRQMREKLNEVIQKADTADMNEAFDEPPEPVQTNTDEPAPRKEQEPAQEQQLSMDVMPPAGTRRPRPPRSCRKPATPGQ